jgi:hypothetical protein
MVHFLNVEYIFLWIYETAKSFDPAAIINWIVEYILTPLRPFALVITLLMIMWMVYSIIRFHEIEEAEIKKFGFQKPKEDGPSAEAQSDLSQKWTEVEKNINSNNPSDWRVAIVDADIMLGTILTRQGYGGDTIGDQLKAVNKEDMLTLQDAWAAHKVRNDIAHGGTAFQMNEREAKATIAFYRKVFDEFYHI